MTLLDLSQKVTVISPAQWAIIAKAVGVNVGMEEKLSEDQVMILVDAGKRYLLAQQKRKEAKPVLKSEPEPEELRGYSVSVAGQEDELASEKEARAKEMLETLVKERRIFIDASSLLAPQSLKTFPNLIQVQKKYRRKINIHQSVADALNAAAHDDQDLERKKIAQNSIRQLQELQKEKLLEFRESVEANSSPAKDIYQSCSYFRMDVPLLVITQDADLTADLIALNRQESARGHNVFVKKFNKYGYLSNVIDPPHNAKPQRASENTRPMHPGKFLIAKQVRQEPDRLLNVTVLPKEGDAVYTDPNCHGVLHLEEMRAEGGEGRIYSTDTGYVAKIFKENQVTAYRQEKITKMVQAKLQYSGICFPVEVLYNRYGEFVGYLMPEAKGVDLLNCMRKEKIARRFPDWTRKDLAQLAITILYKIRYIHEKGLLIGDINEKNIMVVSPVEVYLVDTDSYQVNDLPCQVGVDSFIAPELLERRAKGEFTEFSEILRTKENEYFALATLMFLILMQGKPPYSHANGGSIVQNIMKMHFPYADREKGSDRAPDGVWRFIWSHLGYNIKQAFQKCFNKQKGTSPYNMKDRLNAEKWLLEMDRYHEALCRVESELQAYRQKIASGAASAKELPPPEDEQDLWLYPTRLKWKRIDGKYSLRLCEHCGEWACDSQLKRGWCPDCREKGEVKTCSCCNEEFIYPDFEKLYAKNRGEVICRDCHMKKQKERQSRDVVIYEGQCQRPGCTEHARITQWMADEDMKNFGEVRYWCNSCRRLFNKQRRGNRNFSGNPAQPDAQPRSEGAAASVQKPAAQRPVAPTQRPVAPTQRPVTPTQRPVTPTQRPVTPTQRPVASPQQANRSQPAAKPRKSSGSTGCFITTAVCDYYGKPDDCRELTDFRSFRDNWLRHQPGGEELVREYYETAPELVRRMRASDAFGAICTEIWEDYLLPCQQMIHENRMEDCREHYVAMVRHLQIRVGCV